VFVELSMIRSKNSNCFFDSSFQICTVLLGEEEEVRMLLAKHMPVLKSK
jgi:hypothetical protein